VDMPIPGQLKYKFVDLVKEHSEKEKGIFW
jgi:hypothetical protein